VIDQIYQNIYNESVSFLYQGRKVSPLPVLRIKLSLTSMQIGQTLWEIILAELTTDRSITLLVARQTFVI
jgi:hypothetical protein